MADTISAVAGLLVSIATIALLPLEMRKLRAEARRAEAEARRLERE